VRGARYWLPFLAGFGSLIGSAWVPPVVGWLLIILAFGLFLDVATSLFERAGGTGSLWDHKQ
jgi:hypothetical protein